MTQNHFWRQRKIPQVPGSSLTASQLTCQAESWTKRGPKMRRGQLCRDFRHNGAVCAKHVVAWSLFSEAAALFRRYTFLGDEESFSLVILAFKYPHWWLSKQWPCAQMLIHKIYSYAWFLSRKRYRWRKLYKWSFQLITFRNHDAERKKVKRCEISLLVITSSSARWIPWICHMRNLVFHVASS